MLRYIAKICFVVLLVFQNLDTADAYEYPGTYVHKYTYCGSYYCNGKNTCGSSDGAINYAKTYITDDIKGCGSWIYSSPRCSTGYPDGQCGCSNHWEGTVECSYACYGFYKTEDDSFVKKATYAVVGSNGIYNIDPPLECDSRDFIYTCNGYNKYYAPRGTTVECDVDDSTVASHREVLKFTDCTGCEYCAHDAIIYEDVTDGLQHGMRQVFRFRYDGVNSSCDSEPTEYWRCAPGYYQSGTKTVDDLETYPNIECAPCSRGTYVGAGATKEEECTSCPEGSTTYTLTDDGFEYKPGNPCKPCPKGYYEEDKLCKPCSGNTYQDKEGQTKCENCPTGFIIDNKDLQKNITQCYIDPPNIQLSDSLGTINLADEIGSAPLYYVGP